MLQIHRPRVLLSATALVTTLLAAACGSGDSARMGPMGPSSMSGRSDSSGGMGGMGMGMGMGMEVRNEFDYLTRMIPHHEEAIVAAKALQSGTQRPEMRTFAASIIETQAAEVKQMQAWLAAWYPGRDTRVTYMPMMRTLTGLGGAALDRAFLEDMIPHHMMAVMMSQQFLAANLADHGEVVPFARNIRDTQQTEIQTMAGWLRDWFGGTHGGTLQEIP